MTTTMILHDTRLLGGMPHGYDFSFATNENTPLADAVGMVRACGQQRRIDSLHIFCHGGSFHADIGVGMSTAAAMTGFGLILCRENLTLRSVHRMHAWRGLIGQIVLFACHPAATAGRNEGTMGDGLRLCGELSLLTQADVIAARDIQLYSRIEDSFWSRYVVPAAPLDFGGWEGPVYRFTPNGPQGGEHYVPRPHTPNRAGLY
jgi:hypothetical protein